MTTSRWTAVAALLAGLGVITGAFGAHALHDRLAAGGHVATWETGVRYQVWHALALFSWALWRERRPGSSAVAWCFLVGAILFSGSIYCLSLGVLVSVMGPITPLGGSLLIVGWGILCVQALRTPPSR